MLCYTVKDESLKRIFQEISSILASLKIDRCRNCFAKFRQIEREAWTFFLEKEGRAQFGKVGKELAGSTRKVETFRDGLSRGQIAVLLWHVYQSGEGSWRDCEVIGLVPC